MLKAAGVPHVGTHSIRHRATTDIANSGVSTKVMAANYQTVLPDAELLQKELENTRRLLESHGTLSLKDDKP